MGIGYDLVNPDKKEYFNPAMNGGYLRRRQIFKGGMHLLALEELLYNVVSEKGPEENK